MSDPHLSMTIIRIIALCDDYPGGELHANAYCMNLGGHGMFHFNLELVEDEDLRNEIIEHFESSKGARIEPFRVFAYMNIDAQFSYQEDLMLNLFEKAHKGGFDD